MELIRRDRNKTGYFGVHYNKCSPNHRKPYVAYIQHPPGTRLFLGRFSTAEQAAKKVARAIKVLNRKPWWNPRKGRCKFGHVLRAQADYARKGQCRVCRNAYECERRRQRIHS